MRVEMDKICADVNNGDRAVNSAQKIVEAVNIENNKLKQQLDCRISIIDELKRQVKEGEDEILRFSLQAKEVPLLKSIEQKLRGQVDALTKEVSRLNLDIEKEKKRYSFQIENLEKDLEQEKFMKSKIIKDYSELTSTDSSTKQQIQELTKSVRKLENENEELKINLNKAKSELVAANEKFITETKLIKDNCLQAITSMQTSKSQEPMEKSKDATLPRFGKTSNSDQESRKVEQTREILMAGIEELLHSFSILDQYLNSVISSESPQLQQAKENADKLTKQLHDLFAHQQKELDDHLQSAAKNHDKYEELFMEQQFIIYELRCRVEEYENLMATFNESIDKRVGGLVEAGNKKIRASEVKADTMFAELQEIELILTDVEKEQPNVVNFSCRERSSLASHARQVIKSLSVIVADSAPRKELEMLILVLEQRESQVCRLQKQALLDKQSVKELEDRESELCQELHESKLQISNKNKEIGDLKKQQESLVLKYEELACAQIATNGELKKQSMDSNTQNTELLYELKRLKTELASKDFEIREMAFELDNIRRELQSKQDQLSKLEHHMKAVLPKQLLKTLFSPAISANTSQILRTQHRHLDVAHPTTHHHPNKENHPANPPTTPHVPRLIAQESQQTLKQAFIRADSPRTVDRISTSRRNHYFAGSGLNSQCHSVQNGQLNGIGAGGNSAARNKVVNNPFSNEVSLEEELLINFCD